MAQYDREMVVRSAYYKTTPTKGSPVAISLLSLDEHTLEGQIFLVDFQQRPIGSPNARNRPAQGFLRLSLRTKPHARRRHHRETPAPCKATTKSAQLTGFGKSRPSAILNCFQLWGVCGCAEQKTLAMISLPEVFCVLQTLQCRSHPWHTVPLKAPVRDHARRGC